MKYLLLSLLLTFSSNSYSYTLEQFGDFASNWHFVTVRYRKDTGEMRFTYANDTAWQALKSNSSLYPEGSIFAKIGVATQSDSVFESSAVPSGTKRVQFMIRNKKKFESADAWDYVLFDKQGHLFPGDLETQSKACAACHSIVPERGWVFSQPMAFPSSKPFAEGSWLKHFKFEERSTKSLPKVLQKEINEKSVRFLTGPLRENIFVGTMDEIRPSLIKEAMQSKKSALLISKDNSLYSLVVFENKGGRCAKCRISSICARQFPELVPLLES